MTDQPRVEAVARAIYAAGRGEFGIRPDHPSPRARRIFEQVWQSGGVNDDQRDDIKLCYLQAQAAIEASDAWLKEQADGVAEKLNEIQIKSVGLKVGKGTWTYMREMKSEKWHIAMIKAKNAITAVTSLGTTTEEPDQ